MEVPGFCKPAHQYGAGSDGFYAELSQVAGGASGMVLLPPTERELSRELDATELAELSLWARDGFTNRTPESTT